MIKKVEKRIRGKKKKQLLKQAGNFDPTIKKSKSSIDDDESDPEEFVNPNSIKSTESDSKKDQKKSESESKKSSNSSKTSKSSKKWQSVQFSNLDILSEFQKHGGVSFEVMDGEGIEVIDPDKMIVESKKKSKSKKGDYKTVAAAAKPNDSNDDNDDGDDSDSDMSYNSEFERELEEMGIGKSDVKKEMKKMDAKPKKVEKSESNKSESRVTESTETKVTEKLNKDKKDKLKVNEKKVTAEDSTKSKSPEEQLAELREKKKKKPLSKAQKELFTKLQLEVGTKKSKKREGDSEDKDDKNSPDTETEAAAPPKKKQKKEKEAKTKSSTIETTSKSSDSPNTVDESNESLLIHPLILQNWSYNILSNNSGLQLHPLLLEGLSRLKFYKPSLVQERCLMAALAGKDIVCAAETGSGKTLAYGLPLVDRALRKFSLNSKENPNELQSLVILPTRELSEQVRQHIMDVYYVSNKNQTGKGATSSNKGSKSSDPFLASRLLVTSLVGGLSPEKQVRILEQKRPAIVLGTPGRLAMLSGLVSPGGNDKKKSNLNGLDADSSGKLANTHNTISDYLKYGLRDTLQCLCLDEADRLVERGHFRDLIKVLDYVYEGLGMRKGGIEEEEDSFEDKDMEKEDETDAESDNLDKNDKSDSKSKTKKSKSESWPKTKSDTNAKPRTLQTLVFSATLATQDDSEGMQQMLQRVNLRNDKSSNLKTIDLTKEKTRIMSTLSNDDTDGNKNSESVSARGNLPSTLQLEELVFNKESDRESLLCHYLLKEVLTGSQCGPGSAKSESAAESDNKNIPPKTIIFVNAITSVYRLSSILSVLFSNGADSGKLASIGVSGKNKNGANLNIGSDVEVLTLHSSMTQRDRLKKMEKFRGVTNTKSTIDSTVSDIDSENKTPTTTKILICTDIAARGLDVSDVGHVVHYQVPRSHESFIHRTGRTARAGRRGRCLILQSPEDSLKWNEIKRKVFGTNGNNKNSSEFSIIPTLDSSPLGSRQFNQNLRPAIDLCVELEKKLHAKEKHDSEKRWYEKAGKELDLDIDHVVGYTSSDTEESEADGRRVYKDDEMDSGLNSKALGKKTEFSKGEKGNLMQMYNQLQQKIRNYVNGKQ